MITSSAHYKNAYSPCEDCCREATSHSPIAIAYLSIFSISKSNNLSLSVTKSISWKSKFFNLSNYPILIFRLDKIGILLISLNTLSIITLSFRHSKATKKGHPLTCKIYSSGMSFFPYFTIFLTHDAAYPQSIRCQNA